MRVGYIVRGLHSSRRRLVAGEVLLFPAMSPTMEEGRLVRFLRQPGESFQADEALMTVETDKATLDVEATDPGTMARLLVAEGSLIPVGTPVALWVEPGDDWQSVEYTAESEQETKAEKQVVHTHQEEEEKETQNVSANVYQQRSGAGLRFPSVNRLLAARGLHRNEVRATGRAGQLLKGDVLAHKAKEKREEKVTTETPQMAMPMRRSPMGQFCAAEATVGMTGLQLIAAIGNGGAAAIAASVAGRGAANLGVGGGLRLQRAQTDGRMSGVFVAGSKGLSVIQAQEGFEKQESLEINEEDENLLEVVDLGHCGGVRGRGGGLRHGVRMQLTVGPLIDRPAPEQPGGLCTTVALGLAFDVSIEEQHAHALLLDIVRQLKNPVNV